MFFVTILLNELLTWVRSQAGTSSLRALFYMDEVFGYFPPVANPPSKQPMLTLLKQARAFGLGLVLATQNPVDLDYKGLANCGTWFLGSIADGTGQGPGTGWPGGASAQAGRSLDRAEMDKILSALGKRTFLLNNVHETKPVVFQTRWAMSYLRGPLTREQIRTFTKDRRKAASRPRDRHETASAIRSPGSSPAPAALLPSPRGRSAAGPRAVGSQSAVPATTTAVFSRSWTRAPPSQGKLVYCPALAGFRKVCILSAPRTGSTAGRSDNCCHNGCREWMNGSGSVRRSCARVAHDTGIRPSRRRSSRNCRPGCWRPNRWPPSSNALKEYLYSTQTLEVLHSPAFKEFSQPGEEEGDFQIRLMQRCASSGMRRSRSCGRIRGQDGGPAREDSPGSGDGRSSAGRVAGTIGGHGHFAGVIDLRSPLRTQDVQSQERRAGFLDRSASRPGGQGKTRRHPRPREPGRVAAAAERAGSSRCGRMSNASTPHCTPSHTHLERLQLPPRKTDITLDRWPSSGCLVTWR